MIRFFFDECLSRPVVEGQITNSLRLFGSLFDVAHLLNKFDMGVKDSVWIPQLAREGNWVIITADRGKRSAVTEKLPLICRAYGVTHVTLSTGLHNRNMYFKALAIESLWGELLRLENVSPGAGYTIKMAGKHFKMAQVTESPPASDTLDPDAPLRQLDLPGQ